ncbi:uncharacterized protein RAG0_04694 [Rhynchosporium agropyri]|uniref:Uncharacterized protein n=1 Tax=Rhynchosporium agropyri TaxID=914238 RepID=A0A1E1K9V6_9HELO|nr:uncharacterized protein RAG0_04694 [Rhynchosporium agropyri]
MLCESCMLGVRVGMLCLRLFGREARKRNSETWAWVYGIGRCLCYGVARTLCWSIRFEIWDLGSRWVWERKHGKRKATAPE